MIHSATPNVPLAELSAQVTAYIKRQRDIYRPQALPLSPDQKVVMSAYFSAELLSAVRWLSLAPETLERPAFYLMELNLIEPDEFSTMAAVTFNDVIVANVPITDDLLFHELVHVEQYRQLGIQRFAELYAKGYLEYGYNGIPVEEQAMLLGIRFMLSPDKMFSVEHEVSAAIAEVRL